MNLKKDQYKWSSEELRQKSLLKNKKPKEPLIKVSKGKQKWEWKKHTYIYTHIWEIMATNSPIFAKDKFTYSTVRNLWKRHF